MDFFRVFRGTVHNFRGTELVQAKSCVHSCQLLSLVASILALTSKLGFTQTSLPEPQLLHPAQRHAQLNCVQHRITPGDLIAAAPTAAHLNYYGGKVISNVKVIMVLYGSGTYQSFIATDPAPSMVSFYQQVVNSTYLDCLCEYNTPSQSIGRGTYGGKFQIAPASTNNGTIISDARIQIELANQIKAGHLPAPDADTVYMMHFPRGKIITLGQVRSCVAGGFCAYHGTLLSGTSEIYYAVLPDMSAGSGCDIGCGGSTAFNNQCSVASHELIEAITDPEVGLASVVGYPLAWYDPLNGENADICNAMQATFVGADGLTYTVQQGWSNHDNGCIAVRIGVPPLANAQSLTNHQGSSSSILLTGTDSNLCPRPLTFTISSNPAHGALSGSPPVLTYTPTPSYFGLDSFQFKVNNGTLDSSPAAVIVTLVPTNITIARLPDQQIRVTFATLPGWPYRLEVTDYLTNPTPWVTVLTTNSGTNQILFFEDPQARNKAQRAYRAATP